MYIYSNHGQMAECSSPRIEKKQITGANCLTTLEFTVFKRFEQEKIIDLLKNELYFYDEVKETIFKQVDFTSLYMIKIRHNSNLSQTITIKLLEGEKTYESQV